MAGSRDDALDPGADLVHLLVVALAEGPHEQLAIQLVAGLAGGPQPAADALGDVGPAVLDEVLVRSDTGLHAGEVEEPVPLPAGFERGEPLRVDLLVVADVDRRRRPLEHVQLAGAAGEVGDALHGGGPRADDADPLVGQAVHGRTGGIATGVAVVPPARVEGVAGERLDAGDAGQLGRAQRAGAHGHEAGAQLVAPVGADDPAGRTHRPRRGRSRWSRGARRRTGRTCGRCGGRARRCRAVARTCGSACARSPRAAAGRSSPRCRTWRRGSGSSTRCRPRRRRPR